MAARIVLRGPELAALLTGTSGPVVRDLIVRAERVKTEMVRLAPRSDKQGPHMADHILKRIKKEGAKTVAEVGVFAPSDIATRAFYVTKGTPPHRIPRSGFKLLVFDVGGETVFTMYVNHPGTKPNAFMVKALEKAK